MTDFASLLANFPHSNFADFPAPDGGAADGSPRIRHADDQMEWYIDCFVSGVATWVAIPFDDLGYAWEPESVLRKGKEYGYPSLDAGGCVSQPGIANTGGVLWVDALHGDNSTAQRDVLGKPYATIAGAVSNATAGDTIMLLPGRYAANLITIPASVTLQGIDQARCVVSNTSIVATTVFSMSNFSCIENLTMELAQDGIGTTTTGILFAGTTNADASVRNVRIDTSVALTGSHTCISDLGSGSRVANHDTLFNCSITATGGLPLAILKSGTGLSRYRGCKCDGLAGVGVTAGTAEVLECDFSGSLSIATLAPGILLLDEACTYEGVFAGGGTFAKFNNSIQMRRVSARVSSVAVSSGGDTIIVTAPALTADVLNFPVIQASVIVSSTSVAGETLTFKLFRNGINIGTVQQYTQRITSATAPQVATMHWFDLTPGTAPVYSLRAISTGPSSRVVRNNRLTAFL